MTNTNLPEKSIPAWLPVLASLMLAAGFGCGGDDVVMTETGADVAADTAVSDAGQDAVTGQDAADAGEDTAAADASGKDAHEDTATTDTNDDSSDDPGPADSIDDAVADSLVDSAGADSGEDILQDAGPVCGTDSDCTSGTHWCEDGHCILCDNTGLLCDLGCSPGQTFPERNGCYPCVCWPLKGCTQQMDCPQGMECAPGDTCISWCPDGDPTCCWGNKCIVPES